MNIYDNNNSIFDDIDLDEMQKTETYKLTFGIFKFSFWMLVVISFAMLIAAHWVNENNIPLLVFSLIIETFDMCLYIFYAAKTSARGLMRDKFAKRLGTKFYFASYLMVGIMYCIILNSLSVWMKIYIGELYLSVCVVSLLAMRNNKVIEKLNKEE